MADVDLLPLVGTLRALPEHVQGVVQAYGHANVAHHTAALRAEVRRLTFELDAATIYGNDRDAHYQQAEARAERLAEALRGVMHWDNGKSEWIEARAALAQEDRNG